MDMHVVIWFSSAKEFSASRCQATSIRVWSCSWNNLLDMINWWDFNLCKNDQRNMHATINQLRKNCSRKPTHCKARSSRLHCICIIDRRKCDLKNVNMENQLLAENYVILCHSKPSFKLLHYHACLQWFHERVTWRFELFLVMFSNKRRFYNHKNDGNWRAASSLLYFPQRTGPTPASWHGGRRLKPLLTFSICGGNVFPEHCPTHSTVIPATERNMLF